MIRRARSCRASWCQGHSQQDEHRLRGRQQPGNRRRDRRLRRVFERRHAGASGLAARAGWNCAPSPHRSRCELHTGLVRRDRRFRGRHREFRGQGPSVENGTPAAGLRPRRGPCSLPAAAPCWSIGLCSRMSGGWDEGAFAYYEDVELGWRLHLLGHEVWLAPGAIVYHKHHGTSGRWPNLRASGSPSAIRCGPFIASSRPSRSSERFQPRCCSPPIARCSTQA